MKYSTHTQTASDYPEKLDNLRLGLACAIIGCIALLSYWPSSLQNGFVFDDIAAIVRNKDVNPAKSSIYNLLYNDYWGTPIFKVTIVT